MEDRDNVRNINWFVEKREQSFVDIVRPFFLFFCPSSFPVVFWAVEVVK